MQAFQAFFQVCAAFRLALLRADGLDLCNGIALTTANAAKLAIVSCFRAAPEAGHKNLTISCSYSGILRLDCNFYLR